jgi:pSer/pThr/pTyr-binding forkhead associated (FHA) protein/uncharacterized RDD family membrane protein YckC
VARLVINPAASRQPRELALPRAPLLIGRDPSNDLVLPDAMVSRRHAVIEYRGEGWVLRDCQSSNGSLVNGDRVEERPLRDGDLVAIGGARLLFRDDEPQADGPGAKVIPHPSSPRLRCADCGAMLRANDAFCRGCGAKLAPAPIQARLVCADCGAVVPLPARFCNACGRELGQGTAPVPSPPRPASRAAGLFELRPAPRPRPAGPRPAPPLRRAAAAAFDWGVVGGVEVLLVSPVLHYWLTLPPAQAVADVRFTPILVSLALLPLAAALAALYFVHFWGVRGATPGQRLLGLAVVDEDGRGPIGVPRAFLRLLGYTLALAPLGGGFAAALFGGRALHDRVAATRVVLRGDA